MVDVGFGDQLEEVLRQRHGERDADDADQADAEVDEQQDDGGRVESELAGADDVQADGPALQAFGDAAGRGVGLAGLLELQAALRAWSSVLCAVRQAAGKAPRTRVQSGFSAARRAASCAG
ncbi:MAG: hypothetical protein U0793_24440 [Gemmataceae bacterium]